MARLWMMIMLLATAALARADVAIVTDGKPTATIVVSAAALAAEPMTPLRGVTSTTAQRIRLAAEELQAGIKAMTGATLPIVADDAAVTGPVILVGASTKLQQQKDLQLPSGAPPTPRVDGYVVRCAGDVVVLAGNDEHDLYGSFYAVADLLSGFGMRWILPGDWGTVAPPQRTLTVATQDRRETPVFSMRTWWGNVPADLREGEARWMLRNRMQIVNTIIGIPGDSYLRKYMPDKALAETRPELFARNLNGTPNLHMPNLSSEEAAAMVADKVIADLEARREKGEFWHSIGFAPDDGLPVDYTPETQKTLHQGFTDWLGRQGVAREESTSEEWFVFVNRVTERVAETFPDVVISTNGYANRGLPPEGVTLHPNISVMYAPIWADVLHPFDDPKSWHGAVQEAQLRRWCALSKYVWCYNYNLSMLVTLQTPIPQTRKTHANYQIYQDAGLYGFFNEAKHNRMEEGLVTKWVRAQLMWDPQVELQTLLDDYYGAWYGPAAKPAAAYWAAIEDALLASPLLGHEDRILPFMYTPEMMAALETHCAAVEALATTEPYATRVKVDRATLEHLKGYMALRDAEFGGRWADCVAALDAMQEQRLALHAISPYLAQPPATKGIERYYSGEHYYGLLQRRAHFESLAKMADGTTGTQVVMAERTARFAIDQTGRGKDERWHAPDYDRSAWQTIDMTKPFYIQGHMTDDGVPYIGRMWYVFDLDVPADAGAPLRLYSPIVTCEAWVWINGEYVGHRPYMEAYIRPVALDFQVTKQLKPGQRNTIAVMVNTGMNHTQAPSGFLGRTFIWRPNPPAAEEK